MDSTVKKVQILFSQCAMLGCDLCLCCEATNDLAQIDQIKHPTQEEEARLRMNRPSPFRLAAKFHRANAQDLIIIVRRE